MAQITTNFCQTHERDFPARPVEAYGADQAPDLSIVDREVMGIQEAIAGLTAGINEHTKRLHPVLLPIQVGEAVSKDAAEKDLGDLGNTLRQARQSIERLQRQLADLRFRLTI